MLYRYVKGPTQAPPPETAVVPTPTVDTEELSPTPITLPTFTQVTSPPPPLAPKPIKSTRRPPLKKLIPSAMIALGSLVIVNVAWPIISHELIIGPQIRQQPILSPLQDTGMIQTIGQLPSANQPPGQPPAQAPQVLGSDIDYTNATTWFPTANYTGGHREYQVTRYTISIPAVNIEDAEVIVGGEDLSEGLIHFPGTSIPGQLGSPVIFGHSMLRQFYNPAITNPDRYMSIFSKIMTLKEDDEIFVDYDGIRYTYRVKDKVEVKPEDVFILQQRLNNRELKLITCTPEGTYLRRGVIVAQLAEVY